MARKGVVLFVLKVESNTSCATRVSITAANGATKLAPTSDHADALTDPRLR